MTPLSCHMRCYALCYGVCLMFCFAVKVVSATCRGPWASQRSLSFVVFQVKRPSQIQMMRIEESRFNCAALLYCSHSFGFQLFGRFLAFLTSSLSSIRLQSSVTSRLDEGMDSGQPGTLRPVHYTHHIKMRSHVIGWLTILL